MWTLLQSVTVCRVFLFLWKSCKLAVPKVLSCDSQWELDGLGLSALMAMWASRGIHCGIQARPPPSGKGVMKRLGEFWNITDLLPETQQQALINVWSSLLECEGTEGYCECLAGLRIPHPIMLLYSRVLWCVIHCGITKGYTHSPALPPQWNSLEALNLCFKHMQ